MDVWSLLKTASTRDYDSIAFKFGIADMRSMLRRLSDISKRGNKKCACESSATQHYITKLQLAWRPYQIPCVWAAFAQKLPESMSLHVGEKIVLEAEVANEQMTVKWLKNGNEITPGKPYQIVTKGLRKIWLGQVMVCKAVKPAFNQQTFTIFYGMFDKVKLIAPGKASVKTCCALNS